MIQICDKRKLDKPITSICFYHLLINNLLTLIKSHVIPLLSNCDDFPLASACQEALSCSTFM